MFIFGLTANKTTGRCRFHVTWALIWGAVGLSKVPVPECQPLNRLTTVLPAN
jgi:hypothetical protein